MATLYIGSSKLKAPLSSAVTVDSLFSTAFELM
jgi:hypothetical protein